MKKPTAARSNKRFTKGSPFSPLARQLGMFALLMAVVGSGLSYSAKARGNVLGTNRYAMVQSDPYTTRTTPAPTKSPTPYKPTAAPAPKTNVTSKPAANPTGTTYNPASVVSTAPTARPTSNTQLAVPTSIPTNNSTPTPTTQANFGGGNPSAAPVKTINKKAIPPHTACLNALGLKIEDGYSVKAINKKDGCPNNFPADYGLVKTGGFDWIHLEKIRVRCCMSYVSDQIYRENFK